LQLPLLQIVLLRLESVKTAKRANLGPGSLYVKSQHVFPLILLSQEYRYNSRSHGISSFQYLAPRDQDNLDSLIEIFPCL
jgi:hypothetical protein